MPVDPAFLTTGAQWSIGPLEQGAPAAPGGDFAGALGRQLESLGALQTRAGEASRELAAGTATDPTTVVMAVERARLAMQLAATLRTKSVDAINDLMRTTV
jgi:flagellar hook-basal body complex protein FliE